MHTRHLLGLFAAFALYSRSAAAGPFTVSYEGQYFQERGVTVGNGTTPVSPTPTINPEVITLSKFDPALGRLLSAELTVTGGMGAAMTNHAALNLPGAVISVASGSASAVVIADPFLLPLLGANPSMNVHITSTVADASDGIFDMPSASNTLTTGDSYFFQQTYTDTALNQFYKTFPFDQFSLATAGGRMVTLSGTHTGFPDNDLLDFSNREATAPNISTTQPVSAGMILSLALLSLQIMNLTVDDGHGLLGYSDFHMDASAIFGMHVSYTYEPLLTATPMPEPATFSLLGIGLVAVAVRHLIKRR